MEFFSEFYMEDVAWYIWRKRQNRYSARNTADLALLQYNPGEFNRDHKDTIREQISGIPLKLVNN